MKCICCLENIGTSQKWQCPYCYKIVHKICLFKELKFETKIFISPCDHNISIFIRKECGHKQIEGLDVGKYGCHRKILCIKGCRQFSDCKNGLFLEEKCCLIPKNINKIDSYINEFKYYRKLDEINILNF